MRLFGHPIHPALVAFPIALLGLTPVWDVLAMAGVMSDAGLLAYYGQLAGLIAGGLAVVTGFADLLKIPESEAATVKVALTHAGFALGVLSLFGLAFAFRGPRTSAPGLMVVALDVAGALALAVTGWLGGELVFRRAVGVEARKPPGGQGKDKAA